MVHELYDPRDDQWYLDQANAAADRAFTSGDSEQALVHRKIMVELLAKRVTAISMINSKSLTFLYEQAEPLSTKSLKGLCRAADAIGKLPRENNYVAIRQSDVDDYSEIECCAGDIQLRPAVTHLKNGVKVSVLLEARHILASSNEAWSRLDRNVLAARIEAQPEQVNRSLVTPPPTALLLYPVNEFRFKVNKNHYKKSGQSPVLEAVRNLCGDIDWETILNERDEAIERL